jgi:hypothetical protein
MATDGGNVVGVRRLPGSSGGLLGWRVEGRLTDTEVARMHEELDAAIAASGPVRVLVELAALEGVEPAAVWEDVERTVGKLEGIDRMALVGDASWHRWLATASEVMTPVEVRLFAVGESASAWAWLAERKGT